MYQRLNAYLSLAFYSITNQMLSNNQNDAASYFDSLYKMADPTNSEAFYFSAQLNARKNNVAGATNDLLHAVALGFKDAARMRQQQEFLQTGINFILIESKMQVK